MVDQEADQIVPVRILLHRINMDVVERSSLRSNICDGIVRLVQCDVVGSIPGEYNFLNQVVSTRSPQWQTSATSTYIGVDDDFLKDVLQNPAIECTTKFRQVNLLGCVDADQSMIIWSDEEFMEIRN